MKILAIIALLLLVACAKRPVKAIGPEPPLPMTSRAVRPKKGDFLVHNCQLVTGKESTCICHHPVTKIDTTDPGSTMECK